MYSKQPDSHNKLNPIENDTFNKNGSSKSSGLYIVNDETEKISGKNDMLRLREMEELNARLEKLVRQHIKN